MPVRNYSSVADETTLVSGINNSATVIIVASTVGFPVSTPYTLALDYGGATEELVDVTGVAGPSLTVTRAVDGTSAAAHGAGAKVRHVSSARDFREANEHINASSGVHGLTGTVVGTTDTQTLTNKTLTAPSVSGGMTFDGTITGGVRIDSNATGEPTLRLDQIAGQTQPALEIRDDADVVMLEFGDNIGFNRLAMNAAVEIDMTGAGGTTWEASSNTVAFVDSSGGFDSTSSTSASTSNFTASAGWSTTTVTYIQKAGWVILNITATRTGANIVSSATGDITNSLVGTITPSLRPHDDFPTNPFLSFQYNSGGADGSCVVAPDTGEVTIITLSPTATIATGNILTFTFTWPVGSL